MNETLQRAVYELYAIDIAPELSRPDPKFGDWATNVALKLAGRVGSSPREIAEVIAEKLRSTGDFSEVTVAGPGFINIRLSDAALLGALQVSTEDTRSNVPIVVETNNPNPFKAMHIGHAFNAVLADTIANLLDLRSPHVYRVSYHGDVGLHVGKSMYSLLEYADGSIDKLMEIPESERNSFMSKMYANGSAAYKESEEAKAKIDDLARQSFEPASALYTDIYRLCIKWSFDAIDDVVARLGNKPIVYRFLESDADGRGVAIVKSNTPRVFVESDGAYVFEGSQHGSFDNVFVSSTGRGLYAARDLGLMQLKNEQFHPKKSYIVTGNEQAAYFKGVIAAAGLIDESQKDQTVNIPTGLVKLTTGKMSSRDGDVIEISWLFDEFKKAIEERGGVATDEIVAGALRYQFLKVKVGSDVVFDINDAVSLSGNTGSYLQYAHARAKTILAKKAAPEVLDSNELDDSERSLVRKLGEFSEIVRVAERDLAPHHICTYLYELAQEFNRFYEQARIIDDERESTRLYLVNSYSQLLARGLNILGIQAPDTM